MRRTVRAECEGRTVRSRKRFGLGFASLLRLGLTPLGHHAARFHRTVCNDQRRQFGRVIVLPGIDGRSTVSDSIVRGLVAAAIPGAIEIIDWRPTHRWSPLHLRRLRQNLESAEILADAIHAWRNAEPEIPVHLIGYSAGAGIALFTMQRLIGRAQLETVTLLSAAVSRRFDVTEMLPVTRRGIWNFYSPLDLPAVGIGTLLFGTMDRRHALSSGLLGFRKPRNRSSVRTEASAAAAPGVRPELTQIRYTPSMIRGWNFGGHFGFTNAEFVRRYVAPILRPPC